MDPNNCVIIVEFGMRRQGKCRNGDDGCMQLDKYTSIERYEIRL